MRALFLGVTSGDYSLVVVHKLLTVVTSLKSTGSRLCGLSSCGTQF